MLPKTKVYIHEQGNFTGLYFLKICGVWGKLQKVREKTSKKELDRILILSILQKVALGRMLLEP